MIQNLETVQLKKTKHSLIESSIIKIEVKEGEFIEVEDIEEMHRQHINLSNGAPFCILLDTSMGYFNTSKEARELVACKEYAKVMLATALIVKNLATQLAGNFYVKLHKPNAPTRLFTNEKDALDWLKEFANKN